MFLADAGFVLPLLVCQQLQEAMEIARSKKNKVKKGVKLPSSKNDTRLFGILGSQKCFGPLGSVFPNNVRYAGYNYYVVWECTSCRLRRALCIV